MIEIRLSTVDRLDEALALPATAVGLGQEGCLTKLPISDELRSAADRVRRAGREVVVVAPVAWPRTADELLERLLAVLGDGPTTIAVNDIGTALALSGHPLVAGLGLTRSRPHSANQKDGTPPRAGIDAALMDLLGVRAIEVDTDTDVTGARWPVRQLVDAVPVGYGRSCPTARRHGTGPPDCRTLCDEPFHLTANARWQLNHGHREPLPAGLAPPRLTVWGNAVYQPATADPVADYRIIDARWHTPEALAAAVDRHS
ncbi:hypothetical protein [Actinophytocola sp.]|uniref:hypothetical protein n=1 Tax=Actinophytocola sp. TaxID=1872138 RepID=UPI002D3EE7FB|nr:hypothetical protein [Actinophytocola sp.]HYQ67831.1 hypothetical protein [Actinophytocola sp.]